MTSIMTGLVILGTVSFGSYVQTQAEDVVAKTNLQTVATVLETYKVTDGKYPQSLDSVVASGDLKNINAADWKYSADESGSEVVISVNANSQTYYWTSKTEQITVGHPGFEPGTSTL